MLQLLLSCLLLTSLTADRQLDCNETLALKYLTNILRDKPATVDIQELLCAREHIATSAAASSALCYHFLDAGDLVSSYRYALRSLENVPHYMDAVACLAATYYTIGSYVKASYYAELLYIASPSLTVPVDGVWRSLFLYLSEHMPALVRPVAPHTSPPLAPTQTQHVLHRIGHMLNGSMSVLRVYEALQAELSVLLRGPSVVASEEFLEHVEAALSPQTHTQWFDDGSSLTGDASYDVRHGPFLDGDRLSSGSIEGQDMCVLWPPDKSVNIFSYVGACRTYGETVVGLSDALNKLGVPNAVISESRSEDNAVLVKALSGPLSAMPVLDFVIWNFEKSPIVTLPGEPYGFVFDQCGREEAAYLPHYIIDSSVFWDSIPSNFLKWARAPESITRKSLLRDEPVYVPGFVTDNVLRMSRLQQRFGESFCANAVDASQPIDILFYGSSNPHRERLKQIFDELAALLDLRVEFHLDYGAFDLERDSLVERSKIVLNLGNTDWPPSSEDQSAHANNSYCNIDIGVEPLGTPVNWHRIKGLLARGKVVVSERSGSPLDEELLSEVVVFADSAALTEVVLLLLYDVNQRRQIERRAVSYMLQDQARAQVVMDQQVVPSALSHLVSAVNKLAADRWPESVSTDCSNRRFGRKAPHPATCEHDIQPNPPHTDGITAKQDSLEWLECQCRSSTFTDMIHTRPLLYSSIVRTGNASSPCFRRMDTSLLIGYLVKRYNYTGVVLHIGCSTFTHLRFIEKHARIVCIQSASQVQHDAVTYQEYLESVLATLSYTEAFDLIIFDSSIMSAREVWGYLDILLPRLSLHGTILIPNMRPSYVHEAEDSQSHFYLGDMWELILWIRTLDGYKIMLLDADRGIGILQRGNNEQKVSRLHLEREHAVSSAYYLQNVDFVAHTFVNIHALHALL